MTEITEKRITIVGTGLMGGSLGLALKRSISSLHITGFDSATVLDLAVKRGAIDYPARSLDEAVSESDLVFICAPVHATMELLPQLGRYVRPGSWISDMCSVKECVKKCAASSLPESTIFIGGHPMTGSEKAGIEHAEELLYENATYILCPPSSDEAEMLKDEDNLLVRIIRSVGARIMLLDAETHDRIAAGISHLPQLLAVALTNRTSDAGDADHELLDLAAGGFRDMTRIASSPFEMWRDILDLNRERILESLDGLMGHLVELRGNVETGDEAELRRRFEGAYLTRASIPERSKGFLKPLSDVFVFVSDRPGALCQITKLLSDQGINIKDIELLKIRQGTGGTFRLGFETDEAAERAVEFFHSANFRAHRLA
jgi:prephenate dehydrogenase